MALKVYRMPGRSGGRTLVCVVAAPTPKSAAAYFGVSRTEFEHAASETRNEHEARIAMQRPGAVFCREYDDPEYMDESWEG
jgi:hypothetical protein